MDQKLFLVLTVCCIALFLCVVVKENYVINTHNNQIYLETEEDIMDKVFKRRENMTQEVSDKDVQSDSENSESKMNVVSYVRPDSGFHSDDISEINNNMKLYYTIYDYRSYNNKSIAWKDISHHGDRLRINSDSSKNLGEVVNRNAKFYGNIAPPYSTKEGINMEEYCLILPQSNYLGIDSSKGFTVIFHGKISKNMIQKDNKTMNLLSLYTNDTIGNEGLSIQLQWVNDKQRDQMQFYIEYGQQPGKQQKVSIYTHQSQNKKHSIKLDTFQTYAFVFGDNKMTLYEGSDSYVYQYGFTMNQLDFSNKKAVMNKTRNVPLSIKSFSIQDIPMSSEQVGEYDKHMKNNAMKWDEELQAFLRTQDLKVKQIKEKEDLLTQELNKLKKCPFEDKSKDGNPCNRECSDIVWSGQILNASSTTSQQKPMNPACAYRTVKYCKAQETKENVCKCFDVDFEQDNAYCKDQLQTLYFLSNKHMEDNPHLSKPEDTVRTTNTTETSSLLSNLLNPETETETETETENKEQSLLQTLYNSMLPGTDYELQSENALSLFTFEHI